MTTKMQTLTDITLGGERPLFESHNLRLERVTITEGESAIKECSDIEAVNCRFEGNYPFWHVNRFTIDRCFFDVGARSGLWYSSNLKLRDTIFDSPKMIREMHHIDIRNVRFNDANETFWRCSDIKGYDIVLRGGSYPFMLSKGIKIDGLQSDSKYPFQYASDVLLQHAEITTKDALWESENVTVMDSRLDGEYLGWHSKNLHLIRCHITGTQPLCYCTGLVLEDCTFGPDCDRAFEYSDLRAVINSQITSVKNPRSGLIKARKIGEIILDENIKAPADCTIIETER